MELLCFSYTTSNTFLDYFQSFMRNNVSWHEYAHRMRSQIWGFQMIEGKTEAYAEAAPEEERGPQKPQKLSGRA